MVWHGVLVFPVTFRTAFLWICELVFFLLFLHLTYNYYKSALFLSKVYSVSHVKELIKTWPMSKVSKQRIFMKKKFIN